MTPLPQAARPTKTTRAEGSMEFAGQQIDYGYMPAAHTDGDLYVHFPKLNLLVVGGVVSAESGRCSTTGTAPGWAAASARSSGSPISSSPTRASCPPTAA